MAEVQEGQVGHGLPLKDLFQHRHTAPFDHHKARCLAKPIIGGPGKYTVPEVTVKS